MLMKNNEEPHEGKDYIFHLMHEGEDKIIFGLYMILREHKDHFSTMQNRYRALTSTWLLAAFAGMGFLLSGHSKIELPFNVLFAIALLCLCTGFGVTLLWFLDVVLYQRFWISTVVEMARIEEKHPWITPTSVNTLLIRKSKKYRLFYSYFYIWINGVLLLIAGMASGYYFQDQLATISVLGVGIILFYSLSAYYMMKKSGELDTVTTQSFR